jgi:hypothetical protein
MARNRNIPFFFQSGFRLPDGSDLQSFLQQIAGAIDSGNTTVNATTQAAALAFIISALVTQFTVASANPAFALPPSGVAQGGGLGNNVPRPNLVVVINGTGSTITAFPGGANDTINGGGAGAGVTIVTGHMVIFAVSSDIGGVRTWNSFGGAFGT